MYADQKLVGLVTKISKKRIDIDEDDEEYIETGYSYNFCNSTLVGTFYKKMSPTKNNIFKRAVNTYPEINSEVYLADGEALSMIMNSLENEILSDKRLKLGKYANELDYANLIVFDLHGEYNELSYAKQIKISDNGGLHIPLWFFNYEEIHSLFIESSEGTSTNQRAAIIKYILKEKKKYIEEHMKEFSSDIITADTPIPFSAEKLKVYLEEENSKEESTGEYYKSGDKKGQQKTKQGQYYGK